MGNTAGNLLGEGGWLVCINFHRRPPSRAPGLVRRGRHQRRCCGPFRETVQTSQRPKESARSPFNEGLGALAHSNIQPACRLLPCRLCFRLGAERPRFAPGLRSSRAARSIDAGVARPISAFMMTLSAGSAVATYPLYHGTKRADVNSSYRTSEINMAKRTFSTQSSMWSMASLKNAT